ncbi:DNA-binding domain-containing protein [Mucilaginibacter sp.]|uniref:HvfC/BufC N-terminal domain-containing protein n=1 Tax=Mucilaginibacter sp. TaxID=1882438 RepID=UPI00284DB66D|nr:DNA-binding domain-containing protein [Mucilaginibacter sp.]MDR3694427.1 DNA-binding domain-containing protein [Mucilaginibacter sp.]
MIESNDISLPQLQNWMQGILVKGRPSADERMTIESVVNQSQRLSALRHLNIYRSSYIARLRACMQNQFVALAYALGAGLFESFADQYLDSYPSESYTLNTLGEKFPAFLEKTRPDASLEQKESWPDFIIELAGFEYRLSEIFDQEAAGDQMVLTPNTPDNLLKLTPVLHLFHHQFPICQYYLDFIQNKEPDLPFPGKTYCAVTRRDYKLGLFVIRGAQYHFLKSMQEGKSVKKSMKYLAKNFEFKIEDLEKIWPEWKSTFIASGFLSV